MSVIDIDRFITDGFVKLEAAVPPETADAARALLWRRIGLSPQDPSGWKEPVVWTSDLTGEGPFGQIVRSPRLAEALDGLCGAGGWHPRGSLGMTPVRFPLPPVADDRGWHIDANAPQPDGTYLCSGEPETMLLLTLLSDVGPDDAPTRIRIGSHRDAAAAMAGRVLDPFEAGPLVDAASSHRPSAYATGRAGDMYLVHPFTVHAADEHRGHEPRFMSQAPVPLAEPLTPQGRSALARAIAEEGHLGR
ncbi:phytanoyl-CoA dioxygenase family protein [Actinocorallia populi]|uniref:phytanoyl-CoA dioxygenase family protein n=1 Tax=Actinocorallia populi TaxID=2079200 RepID=UPI000D090629|nr:phytanoyl-CoA dioxygenase family protein [Actinocorallia populi]